MFKPHFGTCSQCHNDDRWIVVKKGLCAKCNHELKQSKKKPKPTKYRKPTGEKHTFHQVLDDIPDDAPTRCFVCGISIALVTHNNFAHILNKKNYPLFRNAPCNIKIMCHSVVARINEKTGKPTNGCHSDYDTKPRSELTHEMWDKVFELKEELLKEYKRIEKL